jgi:hypothetical protein
VAHFSADRVKETTTTTGTGAITLLGTVAGYKSFASLGMVTGDTCYICIDAGAGDWEVSLATYNSTGPTLTRTTILASSNSNAAVSFSAGTKAVFITAAAGKLVIRDPSGNVTLAGMLSCNNAAWNSDTPAYELIPTDFTTGKPLLFVRPHSGAWQFGLWDGVGGAGQIDFAATRLTFNGTDVFTSAGGTLANATYVTPASGAAYIGAATTLDSAYVVADGKSGFHAGLNLKKGTANRWLLTADSTADSGSDAGSNLQLLYFSDAGSPVGTLFIERASGAWTLPKQVTFQSKIAFSLGGAIIDSDAVSKTLGATLNLNMNGAGGSTAGSANQFGWTFHGSVTTNTGAAAPYEKSVMLVEARTSDPSTDAAHARDIVAFDGRGIIAAGNATGRAWAMYGEGTVETTADGLVCNEFAIRNDGGEQASVDTMTSKYNLHVTNLGSKNVTAGIKFSRSSTGLWYKGIHADESMFGTGTADTFIELSGTKPFCVKPSGKIGQGTTNPASDLHTIGANSSWRIEGTSSEFTIQAQTGAVVLGSMAGAYPLTFVTNNVARFKISGAGQVSISGLANYANDTAAASGGVPVDGLYRNGSVLMVRVT